MGYPETFQGFAVTDYENWSTTELIEFKPKPFGEYDIDIKIKACGICGSDVHTLNGGWKTPNLPVIAGHEVIGEVVAVGSKVSTLKVGDIAGVGAQIYSCLECKVCIQKGSGAGKAKHGDYDADIVDECYCPNRVSTYNSKYADGTVSQGGYSSHIRAQEYMTFPIPAELSIEATAPMLCAGITTYSPLKRNGAGPGKKVGIIGIGGLGHFAVMWAKALGAEVYAFSRTDSKKEDCLKLGADHYYATQEKDWNKDLRFELDLIVSCSNSAAMDLNAFIQTLKVGGKFVTVGLPEEPFTVEPFTFMNNASTFGSSHLGNRHEMIEMLNLAVEKNISSWYEPISISVEGVKEALERCHSGDVKYRFTLTDYEKVFN